MGRNTPNRKAPRATCFRDAMENSDNRYPAVRWHNSLIVRTMLLCAVLLVCLLGSVYAITTRFYVQALEEMRTQTEAIAEEIMLHLTTNPEHDLAALESSYRDERTEVHISEVETAVSEDVPMHVTLRVEKDGRITKVARTAIHLGDRRLLVTASVTLAPQTEILRAFRNRYVLALTTVFVVTLALMVYLIRKTLRPLGELSASCSEISAGNLKLVEVRRNSGEILALERTFNEMVKSLQEKELVEAKLRQAQRLSALGNLAAGIAHDLRNPLNAIKLLSGHALDTLGNGRRTERAAKQLETIRQEVDRLEEIVSGFLSLAKERELKLEPSRLDSLLEECLRLVRKDAESRGIRLVTELRAGDTRLLLDPQQWTRAILNVLINAMDASPEKGRVRLFSRVTDRACQIEIRDDGPGMTKDVIERAFDPYFTTKPTGTGLGLSVTRGIVEEHGGTIEISSAEGQGCQVLITMPLEPGIVARAEPEPGPQTLNPEHIGRRG